MKIIKKTASEFTQNEFAAIFDLMCAIWPSKQKDDKNSDEMMHDMWRKWKDQKSITVYISSEHTIIAHARGFSRVIGFNGNSLEVMAPASVCVRKEWQGQGLGYKVMEKVFKLIDTNLSPVALFQTPVPEFYEKLGAKIISNTFINSTNKTDPQATPWWDPFIMIYPATFNWSDSSTVSDLNGPGF
jgi:predicted N-acetyltransferase YhbS